MKIVGIVLIVAGVIALIYGGFSFTNQKKVVDAGSIQINKTNIIPCHYPLILGVLAIVGGGALLYFGAKEGR